MQRRKASSQEPAEGSGGCARPVAERGPWCWSSQMVPARSRTWWRFLPHFGTSNYPCPEETAPDSEGLLLPGQLKGVLSLFSKERSALQKDFPSSRSLPITGSAKTVWGSHRPFSTKSCEEDHGGEIPDPQMHKTDGPFQIHSQTTTYIPIRVGLGRRPTHRTCPAWLGWRGRAWTACAHTALALKSREAERVTLVSS